jgi:aspartate aminotransferase-like enzyme
MKKEFLLIPGPTPIPHEVAQAMSTEMFNHRGARFKALLDQLTASLKEVFQTEGRLFILTASGTGAMEAGIVNFLSPGQHVISLVNGAFGDRLAKIAEAYGIVVERLEAEWGRPLDYAALGDLLQKDRDGRIKAITVVHNESSTGMMNDVEAISRLRGGHPALLIVDAISSMGAVDIPVDRWNIDVCLTGSQKALMLPPGLALISVREKAWETAAQAGAPRFYFSLHKAQEFLEKGQTPFTPALSQMVAMQKGLELYFAEGREQCYARHRRMAGAARAAARALGLELLVDDRYASMTVTAFKKPERIDVAELRAAMRGRFGVEIAGGQGKLSGQTFRFGHLGAVSEMDVILGVAALEMALKSLGYPLDLGSGVKAAQEVIMAGPQG